MKHLLFAVISVVGGYAVTLFCYTVGLIQPSLYLARLFAEDRGGDTLLVPFLVINTGLSAIGIYLVLWFVARKRRMSIRNNAAEQIVERELRKSVSQLDSSGDA
jgi:hypothetical protein